jgi:MarR family transcriptional regulator, lower aerobic nicotinate degradation pathway regulator
MSVTNTEQSTAGLPRFPAELVASTGFLLKRLGFTLKEQAMRAYETTGLSPYHYAILIALDEDAHETQRSIADALGYDRGQLVGLLDELEERGLVERRRDSSDRRRQLVEMTSEGRRALKQLRAVAQGLEDELLSPLEPAEQERLHALLLRLAEHHLPGCKAAVPRA